MRQGSIRLGRIMGIPLSMDLGVLLIGGLLTWTLAAVVLPDRAPGLVSSAYWSVGAIGAVLFLASLLAHEMAHAIVARRNDVEVEGITLWLFGGYAQFKNEPPSPGADFRITAAGPATSIGLGVVFFGAAWGLSTVGAPDLYVAMLGWLALLNGFLGVFNLLPGAPLDGGRIVAAVLWKLRGDRISGRIGAATAGKFVGLGLVGVGVFEAVALGGFSGLWTMLIGWFLFNAARTEHAHYSGERAIGDTLVGEAMVKDPARAPSWSTVADLVEGPFRATHQSAVAVTDFQGRAVGIVTMDAIRRVPAEHWSTTTAAQLLDVVPQPVQVAPGERLVEALEKMSAGGGGHAVVIADGALVGLLGPDEVRRAIELGRLRGPRRSSPPPPPVSVPQQRWEPPVTAR